MTRSKFWNYVIFGALILSGLPFALYLLSDHSYWLMQVFFIVAGPVAMPLMVAAPILAIASVVSCLVKDPRWQIPITWKTMVWVLIFGLSSLGFLGVLWRDYKLTASASFDNQKYYLVKFLNIDSYKYKLYRCEPLGLLCHSSSGYIGIPHQHDPILLQYDLKTRKVYIQNADQIIQIPDRPDK
jgi:hypothetical protein